MNAKRSNGQRRGGYGSYGLGCMLTLAALAGCDGTLTIPDPNFNPTADAGPDLQKAVGEMVELFALSSTDSGGDTLTHFWRQVSGPSVSMSGQYSLSMSFIPTADGIYEFELTVTDNNGGSDTDLVRVFVGAVQPDGAPTANAGFDRTVEAGAYVELNPANSIDPAGLAMTAEWEALTSGSPILDLGYYGIVYFTAPSTTVDLALEFRLTITNDNGLSGTDTVIITVRGSGGTVDPPAGRCIGVSCPFGQSCDQTSGRCIVNVAEDCAVDADCDDGAFCNGAEVCSSGNCASGIVPCAEDELCDEDLDECYFEMACASSTDCGIGFRCDVYSGACGISKAPTANAGEDKTADEGTSVHLSGSGSDPDYDAITYRWEYVSGPAVSLLTPASSAISFTAPSVTADSILELKLTVTDATGLATADKIALTIKDTSAGAVAKVRVDPTTLSPAFQIGQTPVPQSFFVRNSGAGKLFYSISVEYETGMDWINITTLSGDSTGETDTISVQYKPESLTPGVYKATIAVADPASENLKASIAVTLTVLGETEYLPTIQLDAYAFTIYANGSKGAEPAPRGFQLRNSGNDILYYTITADQPWIQFTPATGEAGGSEQSIEVTFKGAEQLPVGIHTASIIVSDPMATNNPQTIPVTLHHVKRFDATVRDSDQIVRGPGKLTVDAEGDLWVTCASTHQIHEFSPADVLLDTLGGAKGTADGQFDTPTAIAHDSQGNMYVCESGNDRVQKFDASGNFLFKWGIYGTGIRRFSDPSDIAVDTLDFVYVSDTNNGRIQKFDRDGKFVLQWNTKANNNPDYPNGLFVDKDNVVLVAQNSGIFEYTSDGVLIKRVTGPLGTPQDVALDSDGDVLVSATPTTFYDWNNVNRYYGAIMKVTRATGLFVGSWSTPGTQTGNHGYGAESLVLGANNVLYTSDNSNNRILKWSPM